MSVKDDMPVMYDGICQYPKIVQDYWRNEPNYLIEYDEGCTTKEFCAIYFCSNDIWFPHTEEIFRKRIVEKNFFEWYHCRINKAYKHIFVRDVFKQWYLTGINGKIKSTEELFDFLKKETDGYKVITLGSSAGGYASALFGLKLNAIQSLCFNAQFCLERLVRESSEDCNPILFGMQKHLSENMGNILLNTNSKTPIFYVYSNMSQWDKEQYGYTMGIDNVKCIEFKSSRHGIPFLKVALSKFVNLEMEDMERLTGEKHNPIFLQLEVWDCVKQ